MATQRTWRHISIYCGEFDTREGAEPNHELYRILGDQALAELAERLDLRETTWTSTAEGGLTLTSGVCPLPIDLVKLKRVEWDGSDNPLDRTTIEWLDEHEPGWREQSGDPDKYAVEGNSIRVNSTSTDTSGKLVVRGTTYLPEFSDVDGTNPLTYLPWGHQLLPVAEYIVGHLPVMPAKPPFETEAAAMWALQETKRREQVRADALAKWELVVGQLASVRHRVEMEEFRY